MRNSFLKIKSRSKRVEPPPVTFMMKTPFSEMSKSEYLSEVDWHLRRQQAAKALAVTLPSALKVVPRKAA